MTAPLLFLLGGGQAPAVDPYFYSVTSLLHGDGTNGAQNNTFLDSSTNNFTITRNGNTTQGSFSPFSQTGWGNFFDGTGDYLSAASNAAFALPGAFTFECWFYPRSFDQTASWGDTIFTTTATNGIVIARPTSGTSNTWGVGQVGVAWIILSSTLPTNNQWNHIVVVRDSSNNISLFLNGARLGTTTSSASFAQAAVTIGSDNNAADSFIDGYLSNLRLVKGTAVYDPTASTLTVPTSPLTAITNTSLLTCQANRFLDASTNAFAITRNGDVSVQPFSPFNPTTAYNTGTVGGSGYFDGSGDYLSVADNAALEGFGDFTIEFWAYPTAIDNEDAWLTKGWQSGIYAPYLFYVSGSALQFFASSNGSSWDVASNANVISTIILNQWVHVAVSRSGSSLRIFANGTLVTTVSNSTTLMTNASALTIGANAVGGNPYTGYISSVRITNTAVYTAAFTPPTAPLTAVTNTQLLCNFTNAGIFDNAADADYETVGNAQISTSVKKYGTGSISLDGTGDYLTPPAGQNFVFGSGDFTIECWVYPTAFSAFRAIIDSRAATTNTTGFLLSLANASTGAWTFFKGSTQIVAASTNLTLNAWQHVAVVRCGTTIKLYLNGLNVGSATDSQSFTDTVCRIGSTVDNIAWSGYIDDLRVSKGVCRYPYNFTPPTAEFPNIGGTVTLTADPYYDYTTLLLPGNGTNGAQNNTFLDSSTNNFTITRNGNTTQGTFSPFSQTGWGNYFDGSGDFLSVADAAAMELGSGNWTIEMWVNTTNSTAYSALFTRDDGSITAGSYVILLNGASANGVVSFYSADVNSFSAAVLTSGTVSCRDGNWHHIAVVRNGNTLTMYIDGVSTSTATFTGTFANTAQPIKIGSETGYSRDYTGYISNVRLVVGSAVYTANFTPSTTPLTAITNTSLLTCQSNRFVDNSTNAFAITVNGDTSIQAFSPFNPTAAWSAATYGGSGYFDGSGDYLSLSQATAMSLGTGDFTVEAWVYPTANPSSYWSIIDARGSASNIPWAAGMRLVSGALKATFFNGADIQGTITVPLNAWTHVAFARQGSTLRGFVNGVLDINTTMTTNLNVTGTQYIGAIVDPTYDTGYIADCRIVKGTAVYTAGFTRPTAPLTAVTNTQLLLNCTNAGIYDATSKNDLETVGNAQISTTQSKFGGSSMYFDGTGDYLIMPEPLTGKFETSDFTIEYWDYHGSQGTNYAPQVGTLSSGTPAGTWRFGTFSNNGGLYFAYHNGSSYVDVTFGSVAYNDSVWRHFAITRYNGVLRAFVNGIQVGTNQTVTQNFNSSNRVIVGAELVTPSYFTGYIDDLRITKGIARYTSNFTPPTTAFLTL